MNKWLLLPAVLVIALIIWTATTQITKETILNEAQISSRVETFYNGEAVNVIKKGAKYFVTFKTVAGVYEVAVDEENGRFSHLNLLKEIQPKPEEEQPSEETPTTTSELEIKSEPEQQPVRITEQQARTIAQKHYNGEVEATSLRNTVDGGYYLVEIDTENDEVTLQIHAVTGKILSVSFDD